MDAFLESVPSWVWSLALVGTLGLGAWLRHWVFKIPNNEPYRTMKW